MSKIKELVLDLTVLDLSKRFEQLCKVLKINKLSYMIEEKCNAKNIIVSLGREDRAAGNKIIVLGAHYDVYPRSLGFNDNTASVAMLIEFAKSYKGNKAIDIVFFDKEESGMIGSYNYSLDHKDEINYAIIFDIIAFGDTLVASSYFASLKDLVYKELDITSLVSPLPSDNFMFDTNKVPSVLITATESKDLYNLTDKIIVIDDEVSYSLAYDSSFYKTFHGRELDNDITILNFDLVDSLLSKLYTMLEANHIHKEEIL